ncbi:uncharacterized protein LOC144161992 isoform X1 [Haemaphysalis longicornis]
MGHSLPKDLRAVWLERIGLSESVAPRSSRACCRHLQPEAYLYNPEFVQRSAVGMKHVHLKNNTVPNLLLPKTRLDHQPSQRPTDVTTQASKSPKMQIFHQENEGPAVVMTRASTSQVLVMQVPGASASAAAISHGQYSEDDGRHDLG